MTRQATQRQAVQPALLNVKEVARMITVSVKTVGRLVALGRLHPGHRLTEGPKSPVRWFKSDVLVYLARLRSGEFSK